MKIIYSLLICCLVFPCKAQRICATNEAQLKPNLYSRSATQSLSARDTLPDEIITVPVVIHVLYNDNIQNISDAQVISQIESLNKDYRKLNNTRNIPTVFSSLSADARIIFCLAKTDPIGRATTGIIRKNIKTKSWSANDQMKFSASGGDDTWDSKRYLNIWICNLSGGSLGYSSLPGSPADKDGVVIQYDVFGTTGNLRAPFNKGRTATHEIGHWLGLLHLWGDALCGDDLINDTPPQRSYNNGCPAFPHVSTCSINANGDMFMNFMDFTDDDCMSMFTRGQKNKMRSMFASGNARNSFLNSQACNSPSPEEGPMASGNVVIIKSAVSLYPNPAKDFIIIEAKNSVELIGKTMVIFNTVGREIKRQLLTSSKNRILINNMPSGIYVIKIGEGKEIKILRLLKQ
ncbi:MAG: M43 family zinc metalloprotease [Ginsengibacter sp.]